MPDSNKQAQFSVTLVYVLCGSSHLLFEFFTLHVLYAAD